MFSYLLLSPALAGLLSLLGPDSILSLPDRLPIVIYPEPAQVILQCADHSTVRHDDHIASVIVLQYITQRCHCAVLHIIKILRMVSRLEREQVPAPSLISFRLRLPDLPDRASVPGSEVDLSKPLQRLDLHIYPVPAISLIDAFRDDLRGLYRPAKIAAIDPLDGGKRCRILSKYILAWGPHTPVNNAFMDLVVAKGGAMMNRRMFVGLEKVQPGDLVYLTNPWQTLTYRVEAVEIIFPDDSEKIRIRPGRDLLSVFTCTYPNTRRVLVTCERILKEET